MDAAAVAEFNNTYLEIEMKKLVTVTEVEGEGLEAMLGERVLLLCMNYFYEGVLAGVNTDVVQLDDPHIVYATGDWKDKSYADRQKLHCPKLYVRIQSIEAFGASK